jgi:hypothetical protein
MYDSAEMAKLKLSSGHMFSTYDIRFPIHIRSAEPPVYDSTGRYSVPADSNLSYSYSLVLLSKRTALALVQEEYVGRLFIKTRFPSTASIRKGAPPVGRRFRNGEGWVDATGRERPRSSKGRLFFQPPRER